MLFEDNGLTYEEINVAPTADIWASEWKDKMVGSHCSESSVYQRLISNKSSKSLTTLCTKTMYHIPFTITVT